MHLQDFPFEMDEDAEDHSRSPAPSSSSTQTWESPLCPPPWVIAHQTEQKPRDHLTGMRSNPPSQVVEEFFCSSQSSTSLIPLVMSLRPQSDVVKQGYLGKLERNHRRYFVLRAGSHMGPSRLEWYKNEQKFTAMEKSGGKAALFGSSKQGLVEIMILSGLAHILLLLLGSCFLSRVSFLFFLG